MIAGRNPFSDGAAALLEVADGQEDQLGRRLLGREGVLGLQPGDAKGDVNGLVFDHPAVGIADLHAQGVKNDNRVHPVQRAVLPFPNLVQHSIGDAADRVGPRSAVRRGPPDGPGCRAPTGRISLHHLQFA